MNAARTRPLLVTLLLLGLTSGCIGFTRTSAGAAKWRKGVRTVGLLSAVGIYEIHPGGIEERHEEWTAAGARNVIASLQDGLRKKGLATRVLTVKGDAELDEVRLLYAEVASAIFEYNSFAFPFPTKQGAFDYEVGPIGGVLDRAGVDVLVIAAGRDHVGANGRSVGAFSRSQSEAFLSVGLIDRGGRLTWFDVWAERGLDLRKEADARKIVERILANMPEGRS